MAALFNMKMAAITSGRNDVLDQALARLGWTRSELARRSKVGMNMIGDIINFGRPPTEEEANAIQRALGEAGEYLDVLELWSATFTIPKCSAGEQSCLNIRFESLWDHAEAMQLAAPEGENEGMEEAVEKVLSRLSKRTYEVLKRHFWKGESPAQIGDVLGLSHERVRQIESHAFRTLRRPTWFKKLGPYTPRHLKPEPSLHPRQRKHLFENYDASRWPKTRTDIVIGDES
jgi:RNA polymerase sigma factor (sigma-70 family)